jgi:hypothetical protein
MPTGLSITSIVGSLFNITNWANAISKRISIEESSEQLGLTIKTVYSKTLDGLTLLRGWWVETSDAPEGRVWMNLPSLSLKLGKLFKDPTIMAKEKDRSLATAMSFRAVMESVSTIPSNYPIIGAMLDKARSLSDHGPRLEKIINDPYIREGHRHKVFGKANTICREHVIQLMCDRYGVSPVDVEEAEWLISKVEELPCFVSHHVFEKMRDVDYA